MVVEILAFMCWQSAEKMAQKTKLEKDEHKLQLEQMKEKFDSVNTKLKVRFYFSCIYKYHFPAWCR